MSKLDLTKPVRTRFMDREYLDVQVVYSNDKIVVGVVDGLVQAHTWTVDNLRCISQDRLQSLENYEKPVKVKKTVYLHTNKHAIDGYAIAIYPDPIYGEKSLASAEVEFTIGEFAE